MGWKIPTKPSHFRQISIRNKKGKSKSYYGCFTSNGKTTGKIYSTLIMEVATKLNIRSREQGLEIPNPYVGFGNVDSLPPGYENLEYKHITQTSEGWKGELKQNNKEEGENQIIKVTAPTKLLCAQKLNLKCREALLEIPNPVLGFPKNAIPFHFGREDVSKIFKELRDLKDKDKDKKIEGVRELSINDRTFYKCAFYKFGQKFQANGNDELTCAQNLNTKCHKNGFSLKNPHVGFLPYYIPTSKFYNIRYTPTKNTYLGSISFIKETKNKQEVNEIINVEANNAKECALMLNEKCMDHSLPLPNPEFGVRKCYVEEMRYSDKTLWPKIKKISEKNRKEEWNGHCEFKSAKRRIKSKSGCPLLCAQILNAKCREDNLEPPNPNLGFAIVDPKNKKEWIYDPEIPLNDEKKFH